MSYENQYRKKIINTILDTIQQTYQILEKKTDYVYKISYDNNIFMMKILDSNSFVWKEFDSFDILSDTHAERVVGNYRLCSKLGIGALLYKTYYIKNTPVIITEYIPNELGLQLNDQTKMILATFINNMHNMGIYHGDLHHNNIRIDDNGNIKVIDLDTMFYADEINIHNGEGIDELLLDWIENRFGFDTIDEYIEDEKNIASII